MNISQILQKIYNKFDNKLIWISLVWQITSTKRKKRAFLFGSPNHSNMGDQAQTYCIQKWINKNYSDYKVIIFNQNNATDALTKLLQKCTKQEDMIFFHSGYHLTDLYPVKDTYCKIATLFPEHKIVIFPQTINFISDKKDEENVAHIFNNHGNITLLCRDEFSYHTAQKIFNGCKLYLFPDIVTSLIGTKNFNNNNRNGVFFCMRNDIEAFYNKGQKHIFLINSGIIKQILPTPLLLSHIQ